MSVSPKIVKINLLKASKKYQTSPLKIDTKEKLENIQYFSFCEEQHMKLSPKKSPATSKPSSSLVKKLFKTSPNKPKH